MSDPFPPALSSLQARLPSIPPLLTSYHRIATTALHPATNPELASARTELHEALDDLAADLDDLTASVDAAERDPARFGLDSDEVRRRRDAVERVRGEVARLRSAAGGDITGADAERLPNPARFDDAAFGGTGSYEGDEERDDGDAYAAFEQQRQEEMMAEQDEALEGVFRTVGVLRGQADEMGRELEGQAGLIEEVEGAAERVGGKLQSGLKSVGWVIKKNEDAASSCCIAVLIVVLIILLLLVLIL